MLGTVINALSIVGGCLVGLTFKNWISEKLNQAIFTGLGLATLYIGIRGSLNGENTLVIILSIVLGVIIGEWVDLDKRLNGLGFALEKCLVKENKKGQFSEGFISATLLFCIGAMAIVGSLQSGLAGNHEILFSKSILDGVASMIYSSALGIGVGFSAISVILYQGTLTLAANYLAPFLADAVINDMHCVGSLIIIGIALNMLKLTEIKIANFLPSIFLPILIYFFI